jgi:hypothetical protein
VGRDVLSMHPRGRADSLELYGENQLASGPIATITIEQPPNYEDALINSKPLNTTSKYFHGIRFDNKGKKEHSSENSNSLKEAQNEKGQQKLEDSTQSSSSSQRKISFIQLDANQLMLSSSPPKYCDLHFVIKQP